MYVCVCVLQRVLQCDLMSLFGASCVHLYVHTQISAILCVCVCVAACVAVCFIVLHSDLMRLFSAFLHMHTQISGILCVCVGCERGLGGYEGG